MIQMIQMTQVTKQNHRGCLSVRAQIRQGSTPGGRRGTGAHARTAAQRVLRGQLPSLMA